MSLNVGKGNSMVAVTGCGQLPSQYSAHIICFLLVTLKLYWPKYLCSFFYQPYQKVPCYGFIGTTYPIVMGFFEGLFSL